MRLALMKVWILAARRTCHILRVQSNFIADVSVTVKLGNVRVENIILCGKFRVN